MDSAQFESMMDALEDKSQILVDIMNEVGETTSSKRASISEVKVKKTASGAPEKSMTDIYNMLSNMNVKLTSIDKSSKNLSGILDEIRNSDSNKKPKKY